MKQKRSLSKQECAERDLKQSRDLIEELTEQILSLFEIRRNVSRDIQMSKQALGLETYDPEREEDLVRKYAAGDDQKERLLRLLFELSRETQDEESVGQ